MILGSGVKFEVAVPFTLTIMSGTTEVVTFVTNTSAMVVFNGEVSRFRCEASLPFTFTDTLTGGAGDEARTSVSSLAKAAAVGGNGGR